WRRRDGEVVVLIGPSEADAAETFRSAGLAVVTGLDLEQTAALLASASNFVGNDSGVSHLAGVVGCRGAVVFGTTRPQRWRPFAGSLAVVESTGRTRADVGDAVLATLLERA